MLPPHPDPPVSLPFRPNPLAPFPQMFGLPYIIAPQEAEAQCAWLDYNGLVDGVVTDDNDVFLFGALRVYRCGNGRCCPGKAAGLAFCKIQFAGRRTC